MERKNDGGSDTESRRINEEANHVSLSPRYRRRETGVTHNGEIAKEKESS